MPQAQGEDRACSEKFQQRKSSDAEKEAAETISQPQESEDPKFGQLSECKPPTFYHEISQQVQSKIFSVT